MKAIAARQVVKTYQNGTKALTGLSLSVKQGEIFTLLGANGAGKSTLIRILSADMEYDAGEVRIFGRDIRKEKDMIRKEVACVYQQTTLDGFLSVEENMLFHGRLYGIGETRQRAEELIDVFGLNKYRTHPVRFCSGGIRRRLDIALRLMTEPKLLILDEPTVGMDIRSRIELWETIEGIRDEMGMTVFLTTHDLEEARRLSDHICMIKEGREVTENLPDRGTDLGEIILQLTGEEEERDACFCNLKTKY